MNIFAFLAMTGLAVAPGEAIMLDVALLPDAAGKRPVTFDPVAFRAAVAQQFAQAGVAVSAGQGMQRLVIRISAYDPGNGIALDQTARMTANYHLIGAQGELSDSQAVSCEGKANFDLGSTPGARARRALARCTEELAVKLVQSITGGSSSVMVR